MNRLFTVLPVLAASLLLSSCACVKKHEEAAPAATEQVKAATTASKVMDITTPDALKKALADHKKVIIKFYATWCPHCTHIAPVYEELAEKFADVTFLQVESEAKEVLKDFNVAGFPTFFLYVDGKQVDNVPGASPDALKAALEKIAEKKAEEKK